MIRRADAADLPALRVLQGELPERSSDLLEYGVAVGDVLVSTAGGDRDAADRPVGYLLPVRGDGIHVAELVVDPDFRREGRASALLSALLKSVASGAPVTLAVAPDNGAALALYRSRGFEVAEERPDYFASGPALLLRRRAP